MAATQEPAPKAKASVLTRTLNDSVRKKASGIAKGRPPLAAKPQASLSSQKTRQLIRSHHDLNKELAKAEAQGNDAEADELKKRIADLGGLKSYQMASIQGQANDRGGDSSLVLMKWLKPAAAQMAGQKTKPRLLEVGALSTKNACSKSGLLNIERIDLFSQADEIIQQDFMERPVPASDKAKFDIISLSLVLNFVPDAEGRGEMLKRTCQFLDTRASSTSPKELQAIYPALFLVLPAPCLTNSRYTNEERLTCIMASLGYVILHFKQTAKLVYTLWQLRDKPVAEEQIFSKKQVNPGGGKNNFSIAFRRDV